MDDSAHDEFHWRETYYILFEAPQRPTLEQVEGALEGLSQRVKLTNTVADDEGRFESLMLHSPDDYAALEINYESGQAIIDQSADLVKILSAEAEPEQLDRLTKADARLDIMHFEQIVSDTEDDEGEDEMLDPSCLLLVVEALTNLTGGIPVDPASGEILQ